MGAIGLAKPIFFMSPAFTPNAIVVTAITVTSLLSLFIFISPFLLLLIVAICLSIGTIAGTIGVHKYAKLNDELVVQASERKIETSS
jgi:hypothetical protein